MKLLSSEKQESRIDKLLFVFLVIFLITVIIPCYLNYLPEMGEIWNYQYARRILYGQIPYRDFGMLQTPFSAQCNALFLFLFSDKLLVMRIIGGFIGVINGLVAYLIFRLLGKNQLMSMMYTALFVFPFCIYSHNNYSWYSVLFLSLALLFEILKLEEGKHSYELIIGACLGFCTISKQNIGVFGLLGSLVFLGYLTLKANKESTGHYLSANNEVIRHFGYDLVLKIAGWGAIVLIEAIYLWHNQGLYPFLNGMFATTTQFSQSSSVSFFQMLSTESVTFKVMGVLIPLFALAPLFKSFMPSSTSMQKSILRLLSIYAAANLSMVFPISDSIHFALAMPLSVVSLSACFSEKNPAGQSEISNKKRLKVYFLTAFWLLIASNGIYKFMSEQKGYLKHYEFIPMSDYRINQLAEVDNTIVSEELKGKTVYFMNFQADYYLIPLNKFSYKYDSVTRGSQGEQELIQMLASSQNIDVIIRGEIMEPMRIETLAIEDYVRGNMQYLSSLQDFDIYTK